jgi:adenosine deaminase
MSTPLSAESILRAPKVLLHDHLDGGLRPRTVVELAAETGYDALPSTDALDLGRWFLGAAHSGSLDLARDGIVYAEVRFAPELHTEQGLTHEQVIDAVLEGFQRGMATAARDGFGIRVVALLTAMRHAARSLEIAQLAVKYRDEGVAGFDIAGAEAGYPPTRHLDAFDYMHRENAHFTIHAGEGFGLPSIWEAIQWCGADRLGHGVRIIDDINVDDSGQVELGRLAAYVRDKRIALELCPTSNVQTGAVPSIVDHPIGLLRTLNFRVTVNTDNRLMSGCSMTTEMAELVSAFSYGWSDLQWLTINAMKSAFIPFDERLAIINDVIKPGYAELAAIS